jgi:DNA polymerase I
VSKNHAYLIDSSLYIFRAWHSMPPEFDDVHGNPINAVHGFTRFALDFIEKTKPEHCAFAFDASLESNIRNTLYPAYKANRDPAPEELKQQFVYCQHVCAALGFPILVNGEYEADDLIGTAASVLRNAGHQITIISADKDLSQCLETGDSQWDFSRNDRWHWEGVKARYGVHAHQIADYLGLTGDAVDNIPGVPGIGPKTAATLLGHFDSLDNLLLRINEIPFLRMRGSAQHAERLKEHREIALLSRKLATVICDAPLPNDFNLAVRKSVEKSDLLALCDTLKFGPMTRRRLQTAAGFH